jgi:hypothetical protein
VKRPNRRLEQLQRRVGRPRDRRARGAPGPAGRKAVEWSRYYEEARELAGLLTTWSHRSSPRTTASS